MIPRVYLQFDELQNEIVIEGDDAHYLTNVLRKKENDQIVAFNETMGEHVCIIQGIKKNKIYLLLSSKLRQPILPKPLQLIFSILKNDTMSWVFEKATELGVTDFFPIHSDYSQKQPFKKDKWQKVIKNATQQCERFDIPKIHDISHFNDILSFHQESMLFVALERQKEKEENNLKNIAHKNKVKALIVGPEGGWSPSERSILINSNAHLLNLGPYILRAETAVIAALSLISMDIN
ncbi:MAG: hypothetical protein C0432_05170 [Candidatus Puniceispirillum sp.]|nr:hypothetical protein [Candidatus Pelagibacter sp.]MBA4283666.1 hypothetical protein [Candidatus Puniceispirillum sp.]